MYSKAGTAQRVTRVADAYSLPSDIAALVDIVAPTTRFPSVHTARVSQSGLLGIDPTGLRALYGIGSVEGKAPNNKLAALGFLQQYVSPTDVQVVLACHLCACPALCHRSDGPLLC